MTIPDGLRLALEKAALWECTSQAPGTVSDRESAWFDAYAWGVANESNGPDMLEWTAEDEFTLWAPPSECINADDGFGFRFRWTGDELVFVGLVSEVCRYCHQELGTGCEFSDDSFDYEYGNERGIHKAYNWDGCQTCAQFVEEAS